MPDELSDRARAILDAAERAAVGGASTARPAAPAAAAPHAEPSPLPITPPGQLLAMVDQVMHAAEAARRRLDELSVTLDELTRRVDAAGRATASAAPPPATQPIGLAAHPLPPPPARPASGTLVDPPAARAPGETPARLVAVEMAAGGASRLEVDRRLRADFGFRDTRPILDDLYGAGSAPDARLSPPAAPG